MGIICLAIQIHFPDMSSGVAVTGCGLFRTVSTVVCRPIASLHRLSAALSARLPITLYRLHISTRAVSGCRRWPSCPGRLSL